MTAGNEQAHALTASFLQALRDEDATTLRTVFGVFPAVHEEIRECLRDYAIALSSVGIAPLTTAFVDESNGRPWMEMYPFAQPGCHGIDCVVFADGRPTEAVLHGEILLDADGVRWRYRFIGS